MAIFYLNEQVNEQTEEMSSEELLNGLAEACDSMMAMLGVDESTALQRHYKITSKDQRDQAESLKKTAENFDKALGREKSKYEKSFEKGQEKALSSKVLANAVAKKTGKEMHSGKLDDIADKYAKIEGDSSEKEKMIQKAELKGRSGYILGQYASKSGADVKSAYDKGAAKGDKIAQKKAIKETCLYILSVIDDI